MKSIRRDAEEVMKMKRAGWVRVALVLVIGLLAVAPAICQPGPPRGGPGMGAPMQAPPPPPPPVFELIIAASVVLIAAEGLLVAYVAWSLLALLKAKQTPAPLPSASPEPAPATPPVADAPAPPDAKPESASEG